MKSQYHNVILFGAGASVEAGIPLLNSFVDTMWTYAFRGKVGDQAIPGPDREILIEANKIREDLERYNSRASFDIRNLEDILSLLSFEAIGNKTHSVRYNRLVKAVARTIELSCKFPYLGESPSAPFALTNYTKLWHSLLNSKVREASPALITFNYDLVLERTLWAYFHHYDHALNKPHVKSCGIRYHLGIGDFAVKGGILHSYAENKGERAEFYWGDEIPEVEIPYLKLHGSLNWDKNRQDHSENSANIRPSSFPTMVVEEPLILPPVFNKMNSAVDRVWSDALEILREAKNIIIVGYSLPKTDIYMQYFLKSAVGPNSNLQRIIVFDPLLFRGGDQSEEMRKRYLACFSPQFSDRIIFEPSDASPWPSKNKAGTFLHFVETLQSDPQSLLFYP